MLIYKVGTTLCFTSFRSIIICTKLIAIFLNIWIICAISREKIILCAFRIIIEITHISISIWLITGSCCWKWRAIKTLRLLTSIILSGHLTWEWRTILFCGRSTREILAFLINPHTVKTINFLSTILFIKISTCIIMAFTFISMPFAFIIRRVSSTLLICF